MTAKGRSVADGGLDPEGDPVFRLKILPAEDGDCLLLTWGEAGSRLSHMVVDGGRRAAYPHLRTELEGIREVGEELALFVLTHVDADHVEGALAFLRDVNRPLLPKDVWFNGYRQIKGVDTRSIRQGDEWSQAATRLRLPINRHFGGGAASTAAADGPVDVAGLAVTLLSPGPQQLAPLRDRWEDFIEMEARDRRTDTRGSARDRHRMPEPLVVEDLIADGQTDEGVPNGSSIAFVAEWAGRRVLLAGDAHPDVLADRLVGLAEGQDAPYRIDVLKASHHGSAKNTTRDLVEAMDCRRLAVSSSGKIHGHPDPQTIARFLHFGPEGHKSIHFNYATDRTRPWVEPELMERHDYTAYLPKDESGVIEINVMAEIGK